jgi:hypothetical protein
MLVAADFLVLFRVNERTGGHSVIQKPAGHDHRFFSLINHTIFASASFPRFFL